MTFTQARKAMNEAVARRKALETRVYISSLSGDHSLEVGLAYYYRGHYIYAAPTGNLIEPIPYSTRKGIMLQGVVDDGAPKYDVNAEELRSEEDVGALSKSVKVEAAAKEAADSATDKTTVAIEGLQISTRAPSLALRPTPPAEDLHRSLTSFSALRDSGRKAFTPCHGASFLAASAPGSRLASRSASPSGLRPTSPQAGLSHLGLSRGQSSPFGDGNLETNSPVEGGPSRPVSTTGYIFGLGDHALAAEDLPRPMEVRVEPCALHGEDCDGVAVEWPCLTERMRQERGFAEEVPVIERADRQMVDWAGLLEEAKVSAEGAE
ncbi:uncharacterized protein M421DRAFT_416202 [Didymella exigua CBS 183.55]|uniref:Uncharacterized protein n=1 Tax=Didymella exigua CBS 183.55 TaxID=1150837 RepID=A0A6A5RZX8_9PLEO|nr:uncharacterized protein M421DRAFT_416202 [Didymella exigua CBS 183.55]KAF1932578.1 hypothetical protein M421DRAFT_416202 [Didymella exigua CBS 183.55]